MTAVLHLPFIEVASACATACHHCAATCLGADEPKPMAQCIALSIDCAAMCQLAAAAVAPWQRGGQGSCNSVRHRM